MEEQAIKMSKIDVSKNTYAQMPDIKPIELKDTYQLMISEDYKMRFAAEYLQTKIRLRKLKNFNNKIEASQMTKYCESATRIPEPKHDCPRELLDDQSHVMEMYLHDLELRAVIENIDLESIERHLQNSINAKSM